MEELRAALDALAARRLTTWPALYARLAAALAQGERPPFTHIVVDKTQDLSLAQARFLAVAGQARPDGLVLAGDLGQRIFHLPFSWAKLGIDVRGRANVLKVCYRTSHQICATADRLLPGTIVDLGGLEEGRRGTVSVFDGPAPEILLAADEAEERAHVSRTLAAWIADGIDAGEIGLLVRGPAQIARARAVLKAARIEGIAPVTMYEAKELEFRAVVLMACDEDVVPDAARLAATGDQSDLEAIYDTERHLLSVAFTRARDRLFMWGGEPASEFSGRPAVRAWPSGEAGGSKA